MPDTSFVVDGACENSPNFGHCRSLAVYANHSHSPNARIEAWPVLRPGPFEVRQRMMLVAAESIAAGEEIRINYEEGGSSYWNALGCAPVDGPWRLARVPPPPASGEEPVCDRLQELQEAAATGQEPPPCKVPALSAPIPWDGPSGGDARLHQIVPLLSTNGREANDSAWPLVSTHVPGRSGRECRDRWKMIQDIDDNSGWLHTLATRPVSHAEAAEAMIHAHQAAALAAAATADSSDEEEADSSARARCCISGCRHQLLSCFGQVHGGSAIGGAAESHFVCAPCLYRWFASEAALQQEGGVRPHSRRTCPVCKAQLRASSSAIRGDADRYLMGLLKVEETWT